MKTSSSRFDSFQDSPMQPARHRRLLFEFTSSHAVGWLLSSIALITSPQPNASRSALITQTNHHFIYHRGPMEWTSSESITRYDWSASSADFCCEKYTKAMLSTPLTYSETRSVFIQCTPINKVNWQATTWACACLPGKSHRTNGDKTKTRDVPALSSESPYVPRSNNVSVTSGTSTTSRRYPGPTCIAGACSCALIWP